MRFVVFVWAAPLVLFWSWYFVSLNDWSMGYVMLSRQGQDMVFGFYADAVAQVTGDLFGEPLRLDPAELPAMLGRTLVFDAALLFALIAFRRRRALAPYARRLSRLVRGWRLPGERAQPVERALEDEGGRGRVDALAPLGARHVGGDHAALGGYGR
jgi:hypothetical protein